MDDHGFESHPRQLILSLETNRSGGVLLCCFVLLLCCCCLVSLHLMDNLKSCTFNVGISVPISNSTEPREGRRCPAGPGDMDRANETTQTRYYIMRFMRQSVQPQLLVQSFLTIIYVNLSHETLNTIQSATHPRQSFS